MSDTDQLSAEEAICQILSEGEALEFIDVVNEVQKRFRIDVTSTEVEQVYRNLTKNYYSQSEWILQGAVA